MAKVESGRDGVGAGGGPPLPTDAELGILRILWAQGPSTVREIQESALAERAGYTTVLKLLQIMHGKGLVVRDQSARAHVYEAGEPEADTQGRLVQNLMGSAFGGSASRLVQRALSATPASAAERAEIRRLLESLDEEGE